MSKIGSIMLDLEMALQHRDTSYSSSFQIGYAAGHILCMPILKKPQLEIVFGTFDSHTLNIGLSSKQWNQIQGKIIKFYEQKGIL